MHRITDVRVTVDPRLYFHMFFKLCGDNAIRNVLLVTTMWNNIMDRPDLAQRREQELRGWWETMLNFGSSIERFDGTFESAWTAIDVAIRKAPPDASALHASALQEYKDALKSRLPDHKAVGLPRMRVPLVQRLLRFFMCSQPVSLLSKDLPPPADSGQQ
jgi:hypothetical protein